MALPHTCLTSGPENGGTTASVSLLDTSALNIDSVPTVNPLSPGAPSPMSTLPAGVANPVPIPGGVTASISDGTYLYLAGQQLQTSGPYKGLFAGNLTTMNLNTYAVSAPVSISDGTHTKLLFADSNTLWIASSNCAKWRAGRNGNRGVGRAGLYRSGRQLQLLDHDDHPARPRRRPRSFPRLSSPTSRA